MYLHQFEDGQTWQVESEPTEEDFNCIDNGMLAIYKCVAGFFFELTENGEWIRVETRKAIEHES